MTANCVQIGARGSGRRGNKCDPQGPGTPAGRPDAFGRDIQWNVEGELRNISCGESWLER